MGASITLSRALPGHRIYRVERLGAGPALAVDRVLLGQLVERVRRDPLALRVIVELFDRDNKARLGLRRALIELGFVRSIDPRMYQQTLAIDLAPGETELFAGLHGTARRGIRAPAKRGLELRPIVEPELADRVRTLVQVTFDRSNAPTLSLGWRQVIEFSAQNPTISRIVGVFDPALTGPDSLLAFAWGCSHGSYVSYEAGGRETRPELRNTSLGYAPLWDLIAWARRETGAKWFDLGGVGDAGDPAIDGISDFKRYFSREIVEVGEEWVFEPSRGRAAAARVVTTAARWVKRFLRNAFRWGLPLALGHLMES